MLGRLYTGMHTAEDRVDGCLPCCACRTDQPPSCPRFRLKQVTEERCHV